MENGQNVERLRCRVVIEYDEAAQGFQAQIDESIPPLALVGYLVWLQQFVLARHSQRQMSQQQHRGIVLPDGSPPPTTH